MNPEEIKDLLKQDFSRLLDIKLNTVSRNSLYGTLIMVWLRLTFLLSTLSLSVQMSLHWLGFYPLINGYWVYKSISFSAISALVLTFLLRRAVLFFKLMQGKLESERFIKNKAQKIGSFYIVVYSLCYLASSVFFEFSKYSDIESLGAFKLEWLLFDLRFAHFSSLILSVVITVFFVNFEVERVGLGFVFEGVKTLISRYRA